MTPYERYCQLRDEKGVKDKTVADAIGTTRSTFSDWKSGRSIPKASKMIKIAEYFGVCYPYLMCLTDERTLPKHTIETNSITDLMMESYENALERGEIELPEEESDPKLAEWDAFFNELPDNQKDEAMEFLRLFAGAKPEARSSLVSLLKTLGS